MEVYYDPNTWNWDRKVVAAYAIKVFVDKCNAQRKAFLDQQAVQYLDDDVQADYDERVELGKGMLRHYFTNIAPLQDVGWTPVKVEIAFMVPIPHPDTGEQLWCKCDQCWEKWKKHKGFEDWYSNSQDKHSYDLTGMSEPPRELQLTVYRKDDWVGLPVVYAGRCDMLAEDSEGSYWIFDWKLLQVNEPVLTPLGWVPIGQLNDGDHVIGREGKPVQILGASPIEHHEVWEVHFKDGTVIECSGSHKWSVYNRDNILSIKTTEQIANAPSYESFATPRNDLVEFQQALDSLPIHPYALGALIADGAFGYGSLSFSSQSGETVELLRQYAPTGTILKRYKETNSWSITSVDWVDGLKELSLWGKVSADKFIPRPYLFASKQDRILLLQGLMDCDGSTGLLRYSTVSNQLAEDVCHLIRSLGGNASISRAQARVHNNGTTQNVMEYFVNYWLPSTIEPNQLIRKRAGRKIRTKATHRRQIVSVCKTTRTADMRCIAVASGDCTYITRNFVVTHNSARSINKDHDEFLELDDQVMSYVWALRKLGLPIRGFVYHEQKKGFPQPPSRNTYRRLGCAFSVAKNQDTDYDTYLKTVSEEDTEAYEAGLYDAFLEFLKNEGIIFYMRWQIHKSDYQCKQAEYNIGLEALEIIDPKLRIYPSPGRFGCTTCAFRQPCLSQNDGSDYQYALDTMYEKREHYYVRTEPSTDSKGGE